MYTQIHLGDMEHGIAKIYAVLDATPEMLAQELGITFEITRDGLDYCKAALLLTTNGKQFAFRNYYRTHLSNKVEIVGSEKASEPHRDLVEFLDATHISRTKILWRVADDGNPRGAGQSTSW